MISKSDSLLSQTLTQIDVLFPSLFDTYLPIPLKRRVRLWNEGGHANSYIDRRVNLATLRPSPLSNARDGLDILHGLSGQSDHEIKLQMTPARVHSGAHRIHQVFLGVGLVNHATHALAAGFGRKGKTRFTDACHLRSQLGIHGFRPHRGQTHRKALILIFVKKLTQDVVNWLIVPNGKGHQSHLTTARVSKRLVRQAQNCLCFSLTRGSGDHPGLTKPTPLGTTSLNLHRDPIMHRLNVRDNRSCGIGSRVEIYNSPSPNPRGPVFGEGPLGGGPLQGFNLLDLQPPVANLKMRRNINPVKAAELTQCLISRHTTLSTGLHDLHYLKNSLLSIPKQKGIKEGRDWLRVKGSSASPNNKRVSFTALSRPHRNSSMLKHRYERRVGEFILKREANNIKHRQRAVSLQ